MRLSVVLVALASLTVPAAATASTASRSGNTITISGGSESNSITTGHGLFSTGIRDTAGITPGPGCEPFGDDGQGVTCGSLFSAVIVADLGDGNDSMGTSHEDGAVIHGGPGNDKINGTDGDDQLYGDAGSDTIFGSGGDDLIDGGPGLDQLYGDGFYLDVGGNDTIDSRDGERDEVSCGMGVDTVTADSLDNIYVECDQVDRGTPPAVSTPQLPTMTTAAAKRYAGRALTNWYRSWRYGTRKVIGKPLRVSRVTMRFRSVTVRYHGRTYRGWAQVGYKWKNGKLYVTSTGLLR